MNNPLRGICFVALFCIALGAGSQVAHAECQILPFGSDPHLVIKNETECLTYLSDALKQEGYGPAQISKQLAIVRCTRATAYREVGQLNRALKDVDQAIRDAPEEDCGYRERARVFAAKGMFDKSHADLSILLTRMDDVLSDGTTANVYKALAFAERAEIELLRGRLDEAMSDAERSLETYTLYQGLAIRGKINMAAGRTDDAIADFEAAIASTTDKSEKDMATRLIWDAEYARKNKASN